MKIKRITTQQFRNLQHLDLPIAQDFIVVAGPNASGKTNFLEIIFYASLLQAFPPGKSWELIRFGTDYFRLEVITDEHVLTYYYGRKGEKRFERSQSVDGVRKKARDVIGLLPTVSFLPQDLNLLQFSPSSRREYLDEILLQTEAGYEETLADYARVLAQRNELLGRLHIGQADDEELEGWDAQLVSLGSRIVSARLRLVEHITSDLAEVYAQLTGFASDLRFVYVLSPTPGEEFSEDTMRQQLLLHRQNDIASSQTSIGPHRHDWRIEDATGRNLSHFLSRGEQRSVIITLKMQELEFLKRTLQTEPVILLDELLAELDRVRQRQVLEHLPQSAQKFLTTTELEDLPENIREQAQIIDLGEK